MENIKNDEGHKEVVKKMPKTNMLNINQDIIRNLKILEEYENLNQNPYKAKAYNKVIENIQLYDKQIQSVDDLKKIKGVGDKIQDKIKEFLTTGKMHAVEKMQQDEKYILGKKLLNVYGIGPAKAEELLEKITSFDELLLDENKGLLNDKQKIGLKYYDDMQIRIPMAEGKKHYKMIEKAIQHIDKDTTFEMVGSYRRKNKDMGDIDILIKNNGEFDLKKMIKILQSAGYILEILAYGKNKFMGLCRLGDDLPARRIDILVADPSYYYFALLYFTGSFNFNIYMRRVALKKGLSLSEYGFKDIATKQMVDTSDIIHSEEDIFKYLEIDYVPPNKR